MSKTHYQAFYVNKGDENQSLCNSNIVKPSTTTDFTKVDCQRCIKLGAMYRDRGAYGFVHRIRMWTIDWMYR